MAHRSDGHVPRRRIADDRGIHIDFITSATITADNRIEAATRGHTGTRVTGSVGHSDAAAQVCRAILAHLSLNGGTWTSFETVQNVVRSAKRTLTYLADEFGTNDLTDRNLTPDQVWEAVLTVGEASRRNLRTFMAESLAMLRADGDAFRDYLYARALPWGTSSMEGYAPEVADSIEQIARAQLSGWFIRHRDAVKRYLGNLPHDWMHRPSLIRADGVLASREDFRVDRDDLAAAMVALALADNKGPNLSTIRSYTADSVERANDHAAFVTGVKARNRQVLRTPAPAGGLYSFAGILEFVTAATRIERQYRHENQDFDRLLFVPTFGAAPLTGDDVNNWWQGTAASRAATRCAYPERLEFRRLRKAALLRGRHKSAGVIGQTKRTTRLYLADAVPAVILVPGLLNTQAHAASHSRLMLSVSSPPDPETDAEDVDAIGALTQAPAIMDVGVAACASNGQSPDNPQKPCGRGPVACFVCPNGFRTPETIPGLLAAVEFTDNIRKYEPREWVEGDAGMLNLLAKRTLEQFPASLTASASPEDIETARALIACVYYETRTDD